MFEEAFKCKLLTNAILNVVKSHLKKTLNFIFKFWLRAYRFLCYGDIDKITCLVKYEN